MPFGSQHRNERISAIGLELAKGEYDIAILQEVIVCLYTVSGKKAPLYFRL